MTNGLTPRSHRMGCRRDLRDARDHKFKATRGRVPPAHDLSQYRVPIMDQGDLGCCVFHAWTAVARWHIRRHGSPDRKLSRLQGYYDGRVFENSVKEDAGLEIRTGAKVLRKIGVGPEEVWPYVESQFDKKPPAEVYKSANLFSGLSYERVDVTAFAVKRAIVTKGPVVIGLSLFESFDTDETARTGMIPMPNVDKESLTGGHAMYIIGYGQRPGTFTVVNSWGEGWGDNGLCYVPEKLIGSTEFGGDYWVAGFEGGF